MSQENTNCLNCEKELKEEFEFCPNCGQKTNENLTVGVLFYNTISNYFSFDARFFKSFIPLMFKPGYLAKRFLEGKRLLYLHPAQMYLFISVVFFFLYSFDVNKTTRSIDAAMQRDLERSKVKKLDTTVNNDSIKINKLLDPIKNNRELLGINDDELIELDSIIKVEGVKPNTGNIFFDVNQREIDSLIETGATDKELYKSMGMKEDSGFFMRKLYSQMLKLYKERGLGSLLQTFYDTIPIALFFLLPIFAFILKLFYFKKGTYAHHLVFSFYFFSFLFTVFSLLKLINLIWDIPDSIDWLIAFSTFFYLFFALRRFYNQGWFKSFFKANVITFVFSFFVMIAGLVVLSFSFMFY